jgi:hypothetical protein
MGCSLAVEATATGEATAEEATAEEATADEAPGDVPGAPMTPAGPVEGPDSDTARRPVDRAATRLTVRTRTGVSIGPVLLWGWLPVPTQRVRVDTVGAVGAHERRLISAHWSGTAM